MPCSLYICLQDEDKIVTFDVDTDTSRLTPQLETPVAGGPSVLAITTLPVGHTARNTCSQIHLTPSGRFLYVGNRGHNSIAGFASDAATGNLTAIGHVSTEAVPSAFAVDPAGDFVFAAGTASGRLASYRIDRGTGTLSALGTYAVGQRPAAVLAAHLGN